VQDVWKDGKQKRLLFLEALIFFGLKQIFQCRIANNKALKQILLSSDRFRARAKDGVRTRDLDLGKVALYQLSYFRMEYEKNIITILRLFCQLLITSLLRAPFQFTRVRRGVKL
jgi:hypothetical protein